MSLKTRPTLNWFLPIDRLGVGGEGEANYLALLPAYLGAFNPIMRTIHHMLCCWLFGTAGTSAGQAIMQSIYTVPPWNNSGWFRGAENTNGGFTLNARPVEADSADVFDMVLLHTDATGELLWSVEYNMPGAQAALGIARAYDDGHWVLGEDHPDGSTVQRGMLMRTDEYDVPLWTWVVDPPAGTEVRFLCMAPFDNGDVAIVGRIVTTGSGAADLLLLRVVADGSIAWCVRVVGPGLSVVDAVCTTPDDRVVMAGRGMGTAGEQGIALMIYDGDAMTGRIYGDNLFNNANSVVHDPGNGFLITGSTAVNDVGCGVVLRTTENGAYVDASLYEDEVINGYPLADGSQVLFLAHPGGIALMERVLTNGTVPWTAELGPSIGLSQLLPYAEGARYAFFTGDFGSTNTITVTTFSSQCATCNGQPGIVNTPTPVTWEQHALSMQIYDHILLTSPVTVSTSAFNAVGATVCMLPLGEKEPAASHSLTCAWDAAHNALVVQGASNLCSRGFVVSDHTGRVVQSTMGTADGDLVSIAVNASDLASGIYLLRSDCDQEVRACRFAVAE